MRRCCSTCRSASMTTSWPTRAPPRRRSICWSRIGKRCSRTKARTRAFSSEVDTGSREENASKQKDRAPFRFNRNGKGSSQVLPLEIILLVEVIADLHQHRDAFGIAGLCDGGLLRLGAELPAVAV